MTGQVLFLWEGGGQKIEFAQNPEWSGSIFAMKGAQGIREERRRGMAKEAWKKRAILPLSRLTRSTNIGGQRGQQHSASFLL